MLRTIFGATSLAVIMSVSGSYAYAQIDDSNRNLLIEKLDKVYQNLAPKDSSKVAVTLRLADLYAERARITAMKELDGNCTTCHNSEADRKKALKLYSEVLDRAPEAVQGKVMIQVGHLYQLTGDDAKAIEFYRKILAEKSDATLKAEAQLSLGEIYFKRRDFAKAREFYQEVVKNPAATSRGLAAYRQAWCAFNLGDIKSAIDQMATILTTPALLNRTGSGQVEADAQFHEEVSRDYATFIAKKTITKADVESLYKLSPESAKVANVKALAFEAERTGKKEEALQVWNYVYGFMSKPEDRLSAQMSMAQLHLDLGNKKQAAASFETAMDSWKDLKTCNSSDCEDLKRRSRNFVISWNQVEKKSPSPELLAAYGHYLSKFSDDSDMQLFQGQVAKEQRNWPVAWASFDKARTLLETDAKSADKLESTLVLMLDIAEESKDEKRISDSYDLYIQHSPKKTKLFEVQYQKARQQYDAGNYAAASEQLRALALEKSGPAKIRKQAADLSLDALVLLKDEAKIAVWAKEYASTFSEGTEDFTHILQKSILTKSANSAGADTEAAYAELGQFNPAQATPEDRVKFYKNKLILAEKLGKFSEAQAAATSLTKEPAASAEDREFAWTRSAYISEMTLDFAAALTATSKIQSTLKPDEKTLKMALFSELSGQKSSDYYAQYLKTSSNEENKKWVAAELVRKSASPEKEIEAHRAILAKSPELMAQLYTEAYAKNSSDAILKKVSKESSLKSTSSGKLLARMAFLKEFAEFKKKITAHKLETKNENRLAASIKARGQMLDKLEQYTKQAIAAADFTSQLVSLDLLAKESERFYNELLSAPLPSGLSDQEQQQYLSMLSAQATPYQAKAVAAKSKVEEFWKNNSWSVALKESWQHQELRKFLLTEVNALREIAPEDQKTTLAEFSVEATVEKQAARPSIQEVQKARNVVNQNPFDRQALLSLLDLEKKSENVAMTQYLQTRIDGLEKGAMNPPLTRGAASKNSDGTESGSASGKETL